MIWRRERITTRGWFRGAAIAITLAGAGGWISAPARDDVRPTTPHLRKHLQLSTESDVFQETRSLLPDRFIVHETARYVILSDADTRWTRNQVERLERAHHQFHRFAKRLDLHPQPLKHKLVCVLFELRDDYQAFARAYDDVMDPWIAGYYSPQHDRIVFYRAESNPSVVSARTKLTQMQQDIDHLMKQMNAAKQRGKKDVAQRMQESMAEHRRYLAREQKRVDTFSSQVNVATTIHEAIHQLCFHTLVQSPHTQYPLWICEGLATAFETDSPHAAFGPFVEYEPRRRVFQELLAADACIPLSELVQISAIATEDEAVVNALYHQSYALVTWMARMRRKELNHYLSLMLQEPPGHPVKRRHLELFQQAFGAVDRLERVWLRYERNNLQSTITVTIDH